MNNDTWSTSKNKNNKNVINKLTTPKVKPAFAIPLFGLLNPNKPKPIASIPSAIEIIMNSIVNNEIIPVTKLATANPFILASLFVINHCK